MSNRRPVHCWCDNASPNQQHSKPVGYNTRLYQLSIWDKKARCCTRETPLNNQSSYDGTTLGDCEDHCECIGSEERNICVEVKKVRKGRHQIYIEPEVPDCLNVYPNYQVFILDSYEYGRKSFTITNDSGCDNSEEEIRFTIWTTATPSSDPHPSNMTPINWNLKPLVSH